MRLPDRDALVARLEQMIASAHVEPAKLLESATYSGPAVVLVEIEEYDDLVSLDLDGAEAAADEIMRRFDRLVRASDVLGILEPGRYALLAPFLSPAAAGAVMERIRSVFAMPVDVGQATVSLQVRIVVEFWSPDASAAAATEMVRRAEEQLSSGHG